MTDWVMMLRRLAMVAGWVAVLAIAFATLAPIADRPHLSYGNADFERALAFLVMAGAFSLAYPKRLGIVLASTALLAIGLEAGQFLQPTRHGQPHDAVVKIFGALAGVVIAALAERLAGGLYRSISPMLRRDPSA